MIPTPCQQWQGGGGKSPATPDYRAAAEEQGKSSERVTTDQTWANRPDLETPWGKQEWSATPDIDPATGQSINKWRSKVSLSPTEAAAQEAQSRIGAGKSGAAEQLLGQATEATASPFDWGGMPAAPGSADQATMDQYGRMQEMQKPYRDESKEALRTRLANMGVREGDEQWAKQERNQADQFAREDLGMMTNAGAEGRATGGFQSTLRQQAIAEEAQRRGIPLNELNALLGGTQVSMPAMPGFSQAGAAQPVGYANAMQQAGDFQKWKTETNKPDIGSLVGAAAGAAMMFSDVRLKKDIVPSQWPGWYYFTYVWGGPRQLGKLAHEVYAYCREAVVPCPTTGYLMVDYGRI
jgi:hypothetical protein